MPKTERPYYQPLLDAIREEQRKLGKYSQWSDTAPGASERRYFCGEYRTVLKATRAAIKADTGERPASSRWLDYMPIDQRMNLAALWEGIPPSTRDRMDKPAFIR